MVAIINSLILVCSPRRIRSSSRCGINSKAGFRRFNMMKFPFQDQYSFRPTAAVLSVILYSCSLLGFASSVAAAAEPDLKVGETIGPQNWQKIQGMVGENLLSRIKAGYTIQIKTPKVYRPLKEYVEATEKYSGKVSLGTDGELLNYVAGQPFPKIDPSDPQLGQKLAWNFFYRWLGDDYKTGGGVKGGKILRFAIEKDGSERRADVVSYFLFPSTRYTLNP